MLAQKENIQALKQRLDCPLLGIIPFVEDMNLKNISKLLDIKTLA
jgi:dethiobiotin synthetase